MGENPEIILEQNIRDMNDQVPRMNESIAMVKANAGRDDIAGSFAMQLEQVKSALARTQGQLATANAAFDKALAVKKAFMLEKERKTREALDAIRDYRRAQWQKKVADSMEQFEVAGISQTHDEMVRKIEEMTAVNEARMDLALGNVDQQKIQIEQEADQLRANELVKQFKAEMGVLPPQPSAGPPQKTIGGTEAQKTS
jgi:phage shock protein A